DTPRPCALIRDRLSTAAKLAKTGLKSHLIEIIAVGRGGTPAKRPRRALRPPLSAPRPRLIGMRPLGVADLSRDCRSQRHDEGECLAKATFHDSRARLQHRAGAGVAGWCRVSG